MQSEEGDRHPGGRRVRPRGVLLTGGAPAAAAGPAAGGPVAAGLAGRAADAPAADTLLVRALREHRHPLRLTDAGELEGPGAELLLREGRASRFFLIGEEHGVAEVPRLTAALFEALRPAGYRHLAIEVGWPLARRLNRLAADPGPRRALARFYRRHPPGALFYTLREEAGLLVDAVDAADGRGDVLWGIDYDIVADRYALGRLRELAPDREATAVVDRAVALSDSLFEAAREEEEFSKILMFSAGDSVAAALRAAYGAAPGSEADSLLDLFQRTGRINRDWVEGRRYASNLARARFARRNFLELYRRASRERAAERRPRPRVMLKLGGLHVMRGRTPTNVFDVGNLAAELAFAEGEGSFHLMTVGDPRGEVAAVDASTFGWRPEPSSFAGAEWAAALVEAAAPEGWTVYNLRPLRALLDAGELGEVPPVFEGWIWAFDAVVLLTDSTPAEPLPPAP